MPWFRKFAALWLLPLGCALMFLPFPANLSGERTRDVVRLHVPEGKKNLIKDVEVEW